MLVCWWRARATVLDRKGRTPAEDTADDAIRAAILASWRSARVGAPSALAARGPVYSFVGLMRRRGPEIKVASKRILPKLVSSRRHKSARSSEAPSRRRTRVFFPLANGSRAAPQVPHSAHAQLFHVPCGSRARGRALPRGHALAAEDASGEIGPMLTPRCPCIEFSDRMSRDTVCVTIRTRISPNPSRRTGSGLTRGMSASAIQNSGVLLTR